MFELFPALEGGDDGHGHETEPITAGQQALNQFLAGLVTMGIALIGGAGTGKTIITSLLMLNSETDPQLFQVLS